MLNSGTEPLLNVVEEGLFFIGKRYFEYGSLRPDPVSPSGAPWAETILAPFRSNPHAALRFGTPRVIPVNFSIPVCSSSSPHID
jgi:hypothetical protein